MNNDPEHQSTPRGYKSALRADQSEATRQRILDAAITLFKQGDDTATYTALARAARVSVPTVYRHFPERKDLFEALYLRIEHARGGEHEEFNDSTLRKFFMRLDTEEFAKRPRLTAAWEFSRATTVPRRRAGLERLIDERVPGLPEPQRTWFIDLGVVLISSAMAESFRLYLDRSGADTADRVLFALEALFAHAATLVPKDTP